MVVLNYDEAFDQTMFTVYLSLSAQNGYFGFIIILDCTSLHAAKHLLLFSVQLQWFIVQIMKILQ